MTNVEKLTKILEDFYFGDEIEFKKNIYKQGVSLKKLSSLTKRVKSIISNSTANNFNKEKYLKDKARAFEVNSRIASNLRASRRCIYDFLRMGHFLKQTPNDPNFKDKMERYNQYLDMVKEYIPRMAEEDCAFYEFIASTEEGVLPLEELLDNPAYTRRLRHESTVFIYRNFYLPDVTKKAIAEQFPADPKDEFSETRKMNRKFYIHTGLTNTGKTYSALQALKAAKKGAYLSPLRLLALEVQENLLGDGILCSLLTGEEEEILDDATHISSTVDMANFNQEYDVCVIDECQMIDDRSRGCCWTRAILGIRAKEVYLCCAPEAVDILVSLIESCGEEYEIVEHERKVPLIMMDRIYKIPKDIQAGDAIILFSKKEVLALADFLSARGISASVIYGALPYATRKEQIKRFLNHETDVVVSTDAIGMGLNLPVHRVIFAATDKFDGREVRPLTVAEVKQIGGRAGRFGMYDEGFVGTTEYLPFIKGRLDSVVPKTEIAYLSFSDKLLGINGDLVDVLKVWESIEPEEKYTKRPAVREIALINDLRFNKINLSKEDEFNVVSIPFAEKLPPVMDLWLKYCRAYSQKRDIISPVYYNDPRYSELDNLEVYYKQLDLFYSFCRRMGYTVDLVWLREMKLSISRKINRLLVESFSARQQAQNKRRL